MQNTFKFPEGFYWGAATASYQVEGGIENCDWAKAAKEAKVPVCGQAADHYNRYESDFDIAKELGHNAHRLSLEWARIEPEEGKFDEKEIEHYRKVLQGLRSRGIEPFITIWHFTLPLWFSESGGFERKDSPEIFSRYAAYIADKLGDLCVHFATINEPNVWATHGYLYGAWPPFKRTRILWKKIGKEDGTSEKTGATTKFKNLFLYFKVTSNLSKAHNAAYKAIKKVSPGSNVSIVKHVHYFEADHKWHHRLYAKVMAYFQTIKYLNKIKDNLDSIGLNYYRHTKFGDNKNYIQTDMGWNTYPSGIYGALLLLERYKKPIFISEAGVADADDDLRKEYIKLQIAGVNKAIGAGVDVRGHMYWSLLDNYEWALGFEKRFGLVEIDYDTLERKIRPSAYVYKDIIKNNGIVE